MDNKNKYIIFVLSNIKTLIMSNAKEITLDNIIETEIVLFGNHMDSELDYGAITLKNEDREFILDVAQSVRHFDGEVTTLEITLEIDKDLFQDCKFDLTDLDLLSSNLSSEMYFRIADERDIKSMSMIVRVRQTTRTIDLTLE